MYVWVDLYALLWCIRSFTIILITLTPNNYSIVWFLSVHERNVWKENSNFLSLINSSCLYTHRNTSKLVSVSNDNYNISLFCFLYSFHKIRRDKKTLLSIFHNRWYFPTLAIQYYKSTQQISSYVLFDKITAWALFLLHNRHDIKS